MEEKLQDNVGLISLEHFGKSDKFDLEIFACMVLQIIVVCWMFLLLNKILIEMWLQS